MENLLEKLFKDKNLSEQTISLYKRNLKKLNQNKPIKNFNYLRNIDQILDIIKELKPTTQRSYIIAICSVLRDNIKYKKIYNQYFLLLKKFNDDLKINNQKSEKQKQNWMTKEEIQNLYETKKEDILKKIDSKRKLDPSLFEELTNFVILSLYVVIQPRRNKDYSLMKISNKTEDENFNYLIGMKSRKIKPTFILNKYKTDKKYHSVHISIPDELKANIDLYLKFHPCRSKLKDENYNFYFLVDKEGNGFNKSTEITKRLNKIFDRKVSSSLLRNIFLTSKYSDVIDELKKDTQAMSTSVSTALNNYIKED